MFRFLEQHTQCILQPHTHPSPASPPAGSLWQMEDWRGVDFLYVYLCVSMSCFIDVSVMLQYVLVCVCQCVNREIEDGLFCRNPPPTAQASVDHFNLPPHVSEGTAFSETWHTVQGGVTSSDRIDNLSF